MYDEPPNDSSPHASLLPLYMGLAFLGTLAIGLIFGFLARPLVIPDRVDLVEVVATAAISEPQAVAQAQSGQTASDAKAATSGAAPVDADAGAVSETGNQSGAEANAETSAQTNPDAAPTPTIMDFLMSDARHILGADDAPVTIIEFSDFR